MISPASLDDAARVAALFNAAFDDRLITVAGLRYRMASGRPEERTQYWRAEHKSELVGWALGGLDAFAPVRTAGFAGIVVHPAYRREGIGSALWDVVSAHLGEIGARRIVVHSRADDDSTAFAGPVASGSMRPTRGPPSIRASSPRLRHRPRASS